MKVNYSNLENWKTRRKDSRVEQYWRDREKKGPLNNFEQYQKKWNFIETEYSERPSNNGLDLCNPAFAFTTNLAKYLRMKECEIIDGKIVPDSIKYTDRPKNLSHVQEEQN